MVRLPLWDTLFVSTDSDEVTNFYGFVLIVLF